MYLVIGLLIIAVGAFCQSSSYVPINKVKDWSWESFWIVQGVFAWLVFPLIGSLLSGKSVAAAHETAVAVSTFVCTLPGAMHPVPEKLKK